MKNQRKVVFAKTRSVYDSYEDFWRLVRASQFEICHVDEIDLLQPIIYIVTPWNGEVTPILQRERERASPNGKIVWLVLERDVIDSGLTNGGVTREVEDAIQLVDAVWATDRLYTKLDSRFKHVVLGSHPELTAVAPTPTKIYDVSPLAYIWGRRGHIIAQLQAEGVSIAPDAYGQAAQDMILPTTKLMLNMHQYDNAQIVAPLRFAVAAAYQIPIISESVSDPWPFVDGHDFVSAPYDQLVRRTRELLADSAQCQTLAENLKRTCETYRFDLSILAAADDL